MKKKGKKKDCDASVEVPFSDRYGCCLVLRPRTLAAQFTSFNPKGCATASKSSIRSQSSSSSAAPLPLPRSDPLLNERRTGCEAWGLDSFLAGSGCFPLAKRKIDASEGRRGGLSESAGALLNGEVVRWGQHPRDRFPWEVVGRSCGWSGHHK